MKYHGISQTETQLSQIQERLKCINFSLGKLSLKLAEQMLTVGDFHEAISTYNNAIARHPNLPAGAYQGLGDALCQTHQLEEAISAYNTALEKNPICPHIILRKLGDIYKTQGKFDEAVNAYQQACSLTANNHQFSFLLAQALFEKGQLHEKTDQMTHAIESYQEAFRVKPNLGVLLEQQGNTDDAISVYCKSIELNQDKLHSYYNLAQLYLKKSDLKQANLQLNGVLDEYQKMIRLNPSLPTEGYTDLISKVIQLKEKYKLKPNLNLKDLTLYSNKKKSKSDTELLTTKIVDNNKPLAVIVCGFEGGGTTMLAEILKQHPQLSGGFEGGFLLSDKAANFLSIEPYCTNLKNLWDISEQDLKNICAADNWQEVYKRLRDCSGVIKDKSTLLVDKTPRYMACLSNVLQKVPDVPCIVLTRDPRAVLWTRAKRTYNANAAKDLTRSQWAEQELEASCKTYLTYANGWKQAIKNSFGKRILLVQYESLCINPEAEVKRIFEFMGMAFEQSYLSIENKDKRYHPCRGNEIYVQFLTEYKDNLSDETCEKVLQMTEEFKDWWHLTSNYQGESMYTSLKKQQQETLENIKSKKKLSRKDKVKFISAYVDPKSQAGLEIGPNVAPLFSKRDGFNVEYIETVSTAELKVRSQNSGKNPNHVEEIDYIFQRNKNLVDTVGKTSYYDYVVSSHVIEHVPDIISHFHEVSLVLKDSGIFGLIIPDKKLCFDFLKPPSTLGQVLQAHVEKRTEPPLSSCIDEIRYGTRLKKTGNGAWDVDDSGDLSPKYGDYCSKLEKILSDNNNSVLPKESFVHTWFFTCDSFLSIFNDLQRLNIIDFDLIDIHPTGHMDFIVILGKKQTGFEQKSYTQFLETLRKKGYFRKQEIQTSDHLKLISM